MQSVMPRMLRSSVVLLNSMVIRPGVDQWCQVQTLRSKVGGVVTKEGQQELKISFCIASHDTVTRRRGHPLTKRLSGLYPREAGLLQKWQNLSFDEGGTILLCPTVSQFCIPLPAAILCNQGQRNQQRIADMGFMCIRYQEITACRPRNQGLMLVTNNIAPCGKTSN